MKFQQLPAAFRIFFSFILLSCASRPYHHSNKIYNRQVRSIAKTIRLQPQNNVVADSLKKTADWVGAVHFGIRKPNFVIIHHTAQNSCEQTLRTFTDQKKQVSAHYVICRDGKLYHMLSDYLRAWHAGSGKWGNLTDVNSSSVGIEIDNNGVEPFSEAQLNVLIGLLDTLKKQYNIPSPNFIGHADIAPSRKADPGVLFPWKRLAEKGFGLWYGDTASINIPPDFNTGIALRIIGYDITDEGAAITAFRRHFLQAEKAGELTDPEKKILYALMLKQL